MTGAELKTIRESLGLTAEWLAERAKVALRTFRYWESGKSKVPEDVISQVEHLYKNFLETIEKHTFEIKKLIKNKKTNFLILLRYRTNQDLWEFQKEFFPMPCTFHAQILQHVKNNFKNSEVRIIFFEPEIYKKWLKNEIDTSAKRAEWGVCYFLENIKNN